MRPRRADPQPVDVDGVKVVTVGTMLWGLALLASLPFLSTLHRHGHLWWAQTAAVGFLLGLLGIWVCMRRAARLRDDGANDVSRPRSADELPPPLA